MRGSSERISANGAWLVDDVGNRHAVISDGARIVSLVPSLTELLFDLGLRDQVVGRTAYCVHPAGRVRSATSVGGTKRVDLEKLKALSPTHVVVNVDETPRSLAETLADLGLDVIVTHPVEARDNLRLFQLLGAIFGRNAEAEALRRRFEASYETLAAAKELTRRSVLYLIWKEPWMTVSRETYISRMLSLVRWRTFPAKAASRYPVVRLDAGILDDVDLVLFSSEPFPFKERHIAEFRAAFPGHAEKATSIDAQMVSWYGSRAIAGLEYVGALARRLAKSPGGAAQRSSELQVPPCSGKS